MSQYDPNYVPVHNYFLLCVKVIIINDDNKILLLQRSDKTPRAHGWDFAGGGVDKGEDPRDAAIRESLEETGLSIDNIQILSTSHGHTNGGEYVMIGYVAHADDDEVKLSWEHESYKWLAVGEVKQIELPQAHRLILDAYLAQRS
ncbi:MAG TPA: NUDIX domain-containing protein [Candidatus Saccharimonadales bacterium]